MTDEEKLAQAKDRFRERQAAKTAGLTDEEKLAQSKARFRERQTKKTIEPAFTPKETDTPGNYGVDVGRSAFTGIVGMSEIPRLLAQAGKWAVDKGLAAFPSKNKPRGFMGRLGQEFSSDMGEFLNKTSFMDIINEKAPKLMTHETSEEYKPLAGVDVKTGAEYAAGGLRKILAPDARIAPDLWAGAGSMVGSKIDEYFDNSYWKEVLGIGSGLTAGVTDAVKQAKAAATPTNRVNALVREVVPADSRADLVSRLDSTEGQIGTIADRTGSSNVFSMQNWLEQNTGGTPHISDQLRGLNQGRIDQTLGEVGNQFNIDPLRAGLPQEARQTAQDLVTRRQGNIDATQQSELADVLRRQDESTIQNIQQRGRLDAEQVSANQKAAQDAAAARQLAESNAAAEKYALTQNFHEENFASATPPNAAVQLDGMTPQEAVEALRPHWANAFTGVKAREFDIDPDEIVASITRANNQPGLDQQLTKVLNRLRYTLDGRAAGKISGEDLMQARNDLRMVVNDKMGATGVDAVEREALRRGAEEIDNVLMSQMDDTTILPSGLTEKGEYVNELKAYGNWVSLEKATNKAANTRGGLFTPEQQIASQNTGAKGQTTTGGASGQQGSYDLQREIDAVENSFAAQNADIIAEEALLKRQNEATKVRGKLAIDEADVPVQRGLTQAKQAAKDKASTATTGLTNSVIAKFAKDPDAAVDGLLSNRFGVDDLRSLREQLTAAGNGQTFKSLIKDRVMGAISGKKGGLATAGPDTIDKFNTVKPQLVDSGLLSQVEADDISNTLARFGSDIVKKGTKAFPMPKAKNPIANLQASAGAAALMRGLSATQSLMVGNAIRGLIKTFILKNQRDPDPDVLEEVYKALTDSKRFKEALNSKDPKGTVQNLMYTELVGLTSAARPDDENQGE